jgi:drug/metabolite transporter (DMT)-like permease
VLQETWSLEGAAIIAYFGIFQTGLAAALYSIAIRHVPALEPNLILMLEPVLNPPWAFLVIGESPGPPRLVGRRRRARCDSRQGHCRSQAHRPLTLRRMS